MKNMKGITLIALVITIVVLIILAGVAISLSLGENGIFNKAKYASEQYANEQSKEETEIAKLTNEIDSSVNSSRDTITITKEEYNHLTNKVNFSNEEQAIGTWTNGKTLYRKIFTGNIPTATTNGTAVTNTIGNLGDAVVVKMESDLHINGQIFESPHISSNYRALAYIKNNNVMLQNEITSWSGTATVWVYYYYEN